MSTSTDALVDQGLRIAHARMEKAERMCATLTEINAELVGTLVAIQALRPTLLKEYGAVPECVLNFCNAARKIIKDSRAKTEINDLIQWAKIRDENARRYDWLRDANSLMVWNPATGKIYVGAELDSAIDAIRVKQ